jgi:histidinol-phosphatase (PHP family)
MVSKVDLFLSDYHTHNSWCNHAHGNVEDYIKAAIAKGLNEIGLAGHFPMNLMPQASQVNQWAMNPDQFPEYLTLCHALREKYKNQIEVKVGSEVDFFPSVFNEYKQAVSPYIEQLDFLIGSVHALPFHDGARCIDGPDNPTLMKKYGVDNLYRIYYETLAEMANTGFFQIVGHCDLPKKIGVLPTEATWPHVISFLDAVEVNGLAVEINTSGLKRPVGVQYPDDKIILELVQRQIPIVLGSDAHHPNHVGFHFPEIITKLHQFEIKAGVPIQFSRFSQLKKELHPLP